MINMKRTGYCPLTRITVLLIFSNSLSFAGNDVEIVAGGGNTNINASDPFVSTDDSAQLGVDLVVGGLTGGASLSVTTASAGGNTEDGNLTLSAGLDFDGTGANTLTLNGLNNVVLSGSVNDSTPGGDALDLNLNAGPAGTVQLLGATDLGNGTLTATGQGFSLGAGLDATGLDISGITTDSSLGLDLLSVSSLAGAGNDELVGTAGDESVSVTGANAGSIGGLTFSGLGSVDAAGGSDTLDASGQAVALTGTSGQMTAGGMTLSNFEVLSAAGSFAASANADAFDLTGAITANGIDVSALGLGSIDAAGGSDTLNTNADTELTGTAGEALSNGVTVS
ncbi:hypothetical protein MLD59_23350, partial [Verrucomicrobiaceae bacterium E54]|nr:hypothetical protein [Verrucomicrobiaceae bacterium E54]